MIPANHFTASLLAVSLGCGAGFSIVGAVRALEKADLYQHCVTQELKLGQTARAAHSYCEHR